jgi:glycosyltransferase involved in cell wall biosynthesis
MSPIKVSIIIPVYNKEKYLKDCLDSVTNQTLSEIEIICIDDGSTDKSLDILEEYKRKDDRIKVYSYSNHGPGFARNKGLNKAHGEYIAFIDADDWIENSTLECLYSAAKKDNSDLVLFNALEHYTNKTKERSYYSHDIEKSFNWRQYPDIVMNNYLIVCTKLHKKELIDKHDIKFSERELFEDVYFHISSIIYAESITYVNKILYHYIRLDSNNRQFSSIRTIKSSLFLSTLNDIKILLANEGIYDDLEINYIKFKLTELKNLFYNVNYADKEKFYYKLKEDFTNNKIPKYILNQLPPDKQNFYNNIMTSKSFNEYQNQKNEKHVKEKSFFRKVKDKIDKII